MFDEFEQVKSRSEAFSFEEPESMQTNTSFDTQSSLNQHDHIQKEQNIMLGRQYITQKELSWSILQASLFFVDLDLIIILPRLVQQNGIILFTLILAAVSIFGYVINKQYILYADQKNISSFVDVLTSFKKPFMYLILFFFVMLSLRKVVFNQIMFAKTSLFFFKNYFHQMTTSLLEERNWMIISALIMMTVNLKASNIKEIKGLYFLNYYTVYLAIYLFLFFLMVILIPIEYIAEDPLIEVQYFQYKPSIFLDTIVVFITILDKFDISIDVKNTLPVQTDQFSRKLLTNSFLVLFSTYFILGTMGYMIFYQHPQLPKTQNIFYLFINKYQVNYAAVIGNFLIMIGNLVWSIFDIIPFVRFFNRYLSKIFFKKAERKQKNKILKAFVLIILSCIVIALIWFDIDIESTIDVLNIITIPFFILVLPGVIYSFQSKNSKLKIIIVNFMTISIFMILCYLVFTSLEQLKINQ